jgi:hypothetical protein
VRARVGLCRVCESSDPWHESGGKAAAVQSAARWAGHGRLRWLRRKNTVATRQPDSCWRSVAAARLHERQAWSRRPPLEAARRVVRARASDHRFAKEESFHRPRQGSRTISGCHSSLHRQPFHLFEDPFGNRKNITEDERFRTSTESFWKGTASSTTSAILGETTRPLPGSTYFLRMHTGGRSLRSHHRLPYEPPPAAMPAAAPEAPPPVACSTESAPRP